MSDIDYAQEIYKLLASYLPNTDLEIGQVLPAVDISISGTALILELSESDYSFIQDQIANNQNYSYTASGFRIKNRIQSLELYPENSNFAFGFLAKFERPVKNNASTDILLKGFTDTSYNTTYRIVRKIDDFNLILAPLNSLSIDLPTGDLGFYSTLYSSGLNGLKTISDYGTNQVSFDLDENAIAAVSDVDDLDLDTMPNLWFYQNNIIVANLTTFLKNLVDGENNEYLIIDSTSLAGTPIRSKHNNTDAAYFTFSTNAYFYRNYTINLVYILQRNIDDSNNLTKTGADISSKQLNMYRKLTSILRRPIPSNNKEVISSITITEDSVDDAIIEGSVIINYQCSFVVNYLPDAVLDLSDDSEYKINQVNYNSDEIIVWLFLKRTLLWKYTTN